MVAQALGRSGVVSVSQPDSRGWALIGLFALTTLVIVALVVRPELSNNTLFDTIATLVVGSGGLLNAVGYFFGSSKSATAKDETITTLAANQAGPTPIPQPIAPGNGASASS